MRVRLFYIILSLILCSVSAGCSGSKTLSNATIATPLTMKTAKNNLGHKVALALVRTPKEKFGQDLPGLFLQTLTGAVSRENKSIRLLTPQSETYPAFMADLNNSATAPDVFPLAALGRQQGFQGLITATISDVRPLAKKTGIFFFRSMKYYLTFEIALDLIDPYTAAKLVSEVREESVKISQDDYEGFGDGTLLDLDDLNEAVADTVKDLGQQIGEAIAKQPWKASVASIGDGRVVLAVDGRAGLQTGDTLTVFEARRILAGKQDVKFIVPGNKITEIRILSIDGDTAQAACEGQADIQPGDLAIFKSK